MKKVITLIGLLMSLKCYSQIHYDPIYEAWGIACPNAVGEKGAEGTSGDTAIYLKKRPDTVKVTLLITTSKKHRQSSTRAIKGYVIERLNNFQYLDYRKHRLPKSVIVWQFQYL